NRKFIQFYQSCSLYKITVFRIQREILCYHKAKTDSFPLLQGKPKQNFFIIFRICLNQIQLDFQSIWFQGKFIISIKANML
ncbi:unnamed protein product, partial [Brassica oleracea]